MTRRDANQVSPTPEDAGRELVPRERLHLVRRAHGIDALEVGRGRAILEPVNGNVHRDVVALLEIDFKKDQTAAVLAHLQAIPIDAAIEDLPLAVLPDGDERGVIGRGVDGLAQLDSIGLLPGVVRLALHASSVARIGPGDRAHGADHALPWRAFELEV